MAPALDYNTHWHLGNRISVSNFCKGGLRALYGTVHIHISMYGLKAGTSFLTFDLTHKLINDKNNHPSTPASNIFCGGIAGATSTFFSHPLDTIRVRGIKENKPTTTINKTLYRGINSALWGGAAYNAIGFAIFYYLKDAVGGTPTTQEIALFGGIAGFSAQIGTYPLNIVRRRQQANNCNLDIFRSIVNIAKKEGCGSLWNGLGTSGIRTPIATALTLTLNDALTCASQTEQ